MSDIYIIGGAGGVDTLPKGATYAVCNGAYQKHRDADFMFFQDAHFYETIKGEDFRKFKGRVLSVLPTGNQRIEPISEADLIVGKGKKTFNALGKNTGFHAICWALNNGFTRIFLVGFECKYAKGDLVMPEVIAMWQEQHRQLAAIVPCITNLTPESGIDAYSNKPLGD